MPEGHTVHRLARLQQRRYAGRPVAVSSPQGRFGTGAAVVDGRVLERVEAHGKHLFQHYGPDTVVHVHLGLWGRFANRRTPAEPPRGQVRMRIAGATHYADLRGPAACELLDDGQVTAVRARLGEDPLRGDADPGRVRERFARSRAPLAAVLMDQSVIAGLGNVFRAETLFRTGLDPMLPARDLDDTSFGVLWDDLTELLRAGERRGRIETLYPDHDPALLEPPDRGSVCASVVYAYRRTGQPCLVCGTPIAQQEFRARRLYWCPGCQDGARADPLPGR
ncbi:Fpg/Nei family DNA glycosylase [Pseudonocardia sp. HH130630-07]|uniref:Fpg/Nei family DNA glycosylase n=1 Tax=Pseudonocardia sp. HH130630-07 TaxID=1690815 RepID=UPI0008151239|nr:DNA-formamidopyrimidine glycosylase family protein [Pseudonocardia sp. HH130630-07]ANY05257.1 DNA glycosylase [Pseudonocardia sp. HH130630-07]